MRPKLRSLALIRFPIRGTLMSKPMPFCLVLTLFAASAAQAGNNSQFISQTVPARLALGQASSVSVTMRNTGTMTWDWAWYKLSAQNPYDNTVWFGDTRAYLPYGTLVYPGQQATFNFTITAPSTPGIYNFQWKMIQEGTQVFGQITPNKAITVSVSPCTSYADPNNSVADDVGLQCLLDQGGTIKLAPSAQGYENYGYLIGTGLNNHLSNLTLESAPGTNPKATIKAAATLKGGIPFRSLGYNYITLRNLIFDGNRDGRDWVGLNLCPNGFRPDVATVEVGDTFGSTLTNNVFKRAVCGAAVGVSGNYTVDSNTFLDNGTGIESFIPNGTEPWADGIRVGTCDSGHITNNTFDDSTDLSLSIEYTSGCEIRNNLIRQINRKSFGGLGFANHSHPGTTIQYNTIQGNGKMSMGMAIGGNPWCGTGPADGATISNNSISGTKVGLNVHESSHQIFSNTITSPISGNNNCNLLNTRCNVYNSTNMQRCLTMTYNNYYCCVP